MKEKYTGRSFAELRKCKNLLEMEPEEFLHFQECSVHPTDNKPGAFSRFARTSLMTLKATGRAATEAVAGVATTVSNTINNAVIQEEIISKINTLDDIYYKRALANAALLKGDMDQDTYDEKMASLKELEDSLS